MNKAKTKLVRGLAKWRRKTVDFVDDLCLGAAEALSATTAKAPVEEKKEEKKEESPTNLANEYLALYQKTDAALEEWEKMHRRLADYFQQIR